MWLKQGTVTDIKASESEELLTNSYCEMGQWFLLSQIIIWPDWGGAFIMSDTKMQNEHVAFLLQSSLHSWPI